MNNNGWKAGILIGVISSLLVAYLIQPILGLVWNLVMRLGGLVHQGYVDRIYSHAAIAERNLTGQLTLLILIFFINSFLLYVLYSAAFRNSVEYSVRIPLPTGRFVKTFFVGSALLFWTVLLVAFSITNGTMEISASFTQRLTVLAPEISDSEYKVLRARWASMRGKSDYDALVVTMDKRANELGITLPAVRKP
jgi:hypothetical protein